MQFTRLVLLLLLVIGWFNRASPILADSLVITANVPASASDFQLQLTPSSTTVYATDEITYTLTYGWLRSQPTDVIVLQISWSEGVLNGQSVPVMAYVEGSASMALGQFAAQVDTVNRTISWNISPVPTGSNRTVTFKLKSLGVNTLLAIPFTVSTRVIGPGYTGPWQDISQSYQLNPPAPTPTLTPTPATSSPTPSAAVTPTPRVLPQPNQNLIERAIDVAKQVADIVVDVLEQLQPIARNNGGQLAIPAIIVAATPWFIGWLGGVISLINAGWGQILSLLGVLFWRRTNRPWGVVYDSKTKQPLDPVLLTLTDTKGRVYQAVSDIYGRYQFLVEAGQYYLTANKSHYLFPSASLAGKDYDGIYEHLYFGQPITVPEDGLVSFNIPMDQIAADWNQIDKAQRGLARIDSWSRLSGYVFLAGFVWSIVMAWLSPTTPNLGIALCYLTLIAGQWWYRRRHPWGTVYDADHHPVGDAVITLINNRQPLTKRPPVVTKLSGRYAFLVDEGEYTIRVARQHQGVVSPPLLDKQVKRNGGQGYVAEDILLPD